MDAMVWLTTTLAITISLLSTFANIALTFDGGGDTKQQPTLCGELVLPAGYPCSEHVVLIYYAFPIIPLLSSVFYFVLFYFIAFVSDSNKGWFLVRSSACVFFCEYWLSCSRIKTSGSASTWPIHGYTSLSPLLLLYTFTMSL